MSNPCIRLFTRGDDLGSARSANQGIAAACRTGILRNISAMFCAPHIQDAAELLAGASEVCFGLHMTMNAEWDRVRWGPVLPPDQVPALVDEQGHFLQSTKALHERKPPLNQLMDKVQAQLDRGRALGFELKYADAHMGWTWVAPGLAEKLSRWCEREGLLYNEAQFGRLPKVDHAGDPVEKLIAQLSVAASGDYLLVGHPAYNDAEMRQLGHAGYEGEKVATGREWERKLFTDPRILSYCNIHGVEPTRFDAAYI